MRRHGRGVLSDEEDKKSNRMADCLLHDVRGVLSGQDAEGREQPDETPLRDEDESDGEGEEVKAKDSEEEGDEEEEEPEEEEEEDDDDDEEEESERLDTERTDETQLSFPSEASSLDDRHKVRRPRQLAEADDVTRGLMAWVVGCGGAEEEAGQEVAAQEEQQEAPQGAVRGAQVRNRATENGW